MESSYRLTPGSTGPRVRTFINSVGGVDVETQAVMVFDAVGSDGTLLNLDSLAKTLAYNADGTLNYTQITDGVKIWRKTLSWSAGLYTGSSAWVLQ